ncbi:MarR family transcriptional regulator [Brevibacillus humidisoli]|uniref:MarR family winged helix-turn-helix transcriptional regulator n=1 Tax=Brevibacillus humidisoli TaxID=2895522 RepID=UPI001E4B5418|nr:MarR family transcriptional regulator [Brevibacillus humidisoli]UFJ39760.1 MarR family transcriptional regulator [Brevibacillus humidisoli]
MDYLDQLDEVFRQVFQRMTVERNKMHTREFSASQAYILEWLECRGPQKVSDLAEALGTTLSAVTALVDKLLVCGYAVRKRSDEDRRVVYVNITDKGSELLKVLREQRRIVLERFYRGLSDEDLQHLIRIYRQVLKNMQTDKGK